MKKLFAFVLAMMLPLTALAAPVRSYEGDTLRYTVDRIEYAGAECFVTEVWMASPGEQIRKGTSPWHEDLALPSDMAGEIDGAMLAINGSGYVSPVFPWIPEEYPGESADYYYTPLGSLTVTDGEIFRNLKGIPYYGLTLEADGLHMYVGEDNERVLAASPRQTWSFYTGCPMVLDHQLILDDQWHFANVPAMRTIIAQVDEHNYVLLTVTSDSGAGLTLFQAARYLQDTYDPAWVYDLDGGPSSALLCREDESEELSVLFGNTSRDVDVMAFTQAE